MKNRAATELPTPSLPRTESRGSQLPGFPESSGVHSSLRVLGILNLWALLSAFACTETRPIDFLDKDLPPPAPQQIEVWRGEAYRSDPRQVAHYEIQMHLDVPWKGERFAPAKYTFIEHNPERPDWGSYVVRGFVDRSGRNTRYRVKVRRDGSVWYATQVSHYMQVTLVSPALEPDPRDPH